MYIISDDLYINLDYITLFGFEEKLNGCNLYVQLAGSNQRIPLVNFPNSFKAYQGMNRILKAVYILTAGATAGHIMKHKKR